MVRWYGGKKMEESSSKPRKVHYRAHRHMPDQYFIRPSGSLWSWLYGSLMYNHLYNQCLSLLKLWVLIPLMARCTWYKICDNVCQWLAAVRLFSPGTPVSASNKTGRHDIAVILLKVALNTISLTHSTSQIGDPIIKWNPEINFFELTSGAWPVDPRLLEGFALLDL